MNKIQALELCRDLWSRLIENFADYRADTSDMYEAKGMALGDIGDFDIVVHNCPACEFVRRLGGSAGTFVSCLHLCPLKEIWPAGCERDGSPYEVAYTAFKEDDDVAFEEAAIEIIKECDRCIKNKH